MISDKLIEIIYNAFMFLAAGVEPLSFNIDSSVYRYVYDTLAFIFYILPIEGLKPIITIVMAIIGFRIFISVIKTIWQLLPLL